MIRTVSILLLMLMITGCSILGFPRTKPIEIVTEEQSRTQLQLSLPPPLIARNVEWILITPDNAEQVWQRLERDGRQPVLFAVTSEGYEQLSYNMADIRSYIATQRTIIVKYQEYYESDQ